MRINIQTNGLELTDALHEYTQRRLNFALSWATPHIRRLSVRLSDINGPRGGNDKRCKVHVVLSHGQDIVIEDIEDDLYLAIDRVADRVDRAVARQLKRYREYDKHRIEVVDVEDKLLESSS